MTENKLSEKIIGCAIEVHRELGPGLVESVYEEAFCHELAMAGLRFGRQQQVPIIYKGVQLATPLRLDLIVEDQIIEFEFLVHDVYWQWHGRQVQNRCGAPAG